MWPRKKKEACPVDPPKVERNLTAIAVRKADHKIFKAKAKECGISMTMLLHECAKRVKKAKIKERVTVQMSLKW